MRKSKDEFYEFDQSEKKFFLNLKKQPWIEKTLEILKAWLSVNLTEKGFDFQRIFEQAWTTWKVSHKDICFLRQWNFEVILEQYKLERQSNYDVITVDLVSRLESIIAKIPHVLSWLTQVEAKWELEMRRDINVLAPNFLKKIENMSPPIIYANWIYINNEQFKEIEEIFKDSFKLNSLIKVREKINTLWLATVARNQMAFPWKQIIERLYTVTHSKRPLIETRKELPLWYDSDISKYINTEVNIGFFLNKIQNITIADVYVWQELAWYYYSGFWSLLNFTIWKSGSGFTSVNVELPVWMDTPRQWMVKKIEITDISDNWVIQWKII